MDMNGQDKEKVAKTAGDLCGSIACISVCFAVFVVVLSATVEQYQVNAWAVVSIMVGIAIGCLFARVALLLVHCEKCEPGNVFTPVIKGMVGCFVLGLVAGFLLSPIYNQEHDYPHIVQQILTYGLMAFPILLIILVTVQGWFKLARSG